MDSQVKSCLVKSILGHRITITCDDRVILGASISIDPQNSDEIVQVLRDIIAILEAPGVPIEGFL